LKQLASDPPGQLAQLVALEWLLAVSSCTVLSWRGVFHGCGAGSSHLHAAGNGCAACSCLRL
jgi:hypothetical protein